MPDPAPALTVCLCTYNGARRIGEVLEALGRQTRAAPDWEVLVIDNNSTDDTAAVVAAGLAAHLPGRGRIVRETQPGVTRARHRGAVEARGALLAYLDDDNVPAPDYVENALARMARHPEAGLMGGKVLADWIGTPTPLGARVASFALAIRDRGDEPFAYEDITGGPDTAGMVVRTDLLRAILAEPLFADRDLGRNASGFGGGEDTAIVIRAHQRGHACRYEPSLVIRHRLPASRTDAAYLLKLFDGIGRGQAAIRPLFDPKARSRVLALGIALKDFARWLSGRLRGPDAALRAEAGALASDLHALQQRQLAARARETARRALS